MKITSEEQARELREALVEWERGGKFSSIKLTADELANARIYAASDKTLRCAIVTRRKKLPDEQCASYIAWYDANVTIDKELTWEVVRDGSFVVCRCYGQDVARIVASELNKQYTYEYTFREVRHD